MEVTDAGADTRECKALQYKELCLWRQEAKGVKTIWHDVCLRYVRLGSVYVQPKKVVSVDGGPNGTTG